jgi:exonuclease VII small subunit
LDLDEGLEKLKTGKDLIKKCRARLREVENEFIDIKKEFAQDDQSIETISEGNSDQTEPGVPF